jgi:hypothetical protein
MIMQPARPARPSKATLPNSNYKRQRQNILARLFGITLAFVAASGVRVSAQSAPPITNLLTQLKSASSDGDSTLKSLGNELHSKVQASHQSLAGSPDAQKKLNGALQSLLGNKGGEALSAFEKLSQVKLTPEQTKLAEEVGHLGSAYLVHKNLSGLEGSQSDVAQIVGSLRKGNIKQALPTIKKVSQNAKLTPEQKELLTSLAGKVAPRALENVKGIPGNDKR